MKKEDKPIIVEQLFDRDVTTVWRAITQLEEMTKWFFPDIPNFQSEVGFEVQFNVNTGERDFLHKWKILEAAPPQKIVYDWRYGGYSGIGKVVFELFENAEGTRLVVTATGIESFPQDIPEFKWESGFDGWTYFIKKSLKEYLDG